MLIVGAGPTGLSLACQLIRYGIDFIIIDKSEGVTTYSKALGVHARTLEIYEQLGLAKHAVAQGTIAGKIRMLVGGKIRGEMNLSVIGQGMSPYPFMLVLEQSRNEDLLYDYMHAHGKDVLWQNELQSLKQTDTLVTAQIQHGNEESSILKAKYLVGCDGPQSPVRHSLGLSFEGNTFERLFYVADVCIHWPYSHDALHVCMTQNSVLAFFPMPGENRYRIVGAFPMGFAQEESETLYAEIEQHIRKESQIALEISQVNWFSTYKVHTRHVENFSSGRCFLAGDASHIHTPAGGQGMNTGIQDAYNLAWKLAFVLQGKADAKILETYNQERLPNAVRLLETTDRMFNLIAGSNKWVNLIRTLVFPPLAGFLTSLNSVKKRFFPLLSQIGISYRESTLSNHMAEHAFAVKAGDRMPYFLVNGMSVYDKLLKPKFHLITFSNANQTASEEIESNYARIFDYQVLPISPSIEKIFGTDKSFILLLRPDNHIGFISQEFSLNRLNAYFVTCLGK